MCNPTGDKAIQYCIVGAICAAGVDYSYAHCLLASLGSKTEYGNLVTFNNKQTSAEPILELIDKAIAIEMKKSP